MRSASAQPWQRAGQAGLPSSAPARHGRRHAFGHVALAAAMREAVQVQQAPAAQHMLDLGAAVAARAASRTKSISLSVRGAKSA